jgi:hypothetical protein
MFPVLLFKLHGFDTVDVRLKGWDDESKKAAKTFIFGIIENRFWIKSSISTVPFQTLISPS